MNKPSDRRNSIKSMSNILPKSPKIALITSLRSQAIRYAKDQGCVSMIEFGELYKWVGQFRDINGIAFGSYIKLYSWNNVFNVDEIIKQLELKGAKELQDE